MLLSEKKRNEMARNNSPPSYEEFIHCLENCICTFGNISTGHAFKVKKDYSGDVGCGGSHLPRHCGYLTLHFQIPDLAHY
jgi:hypothetical protein